MQGKTPYLNKSISRAIDAQKKNNYREISSKRLSISKLGLEQGVPTGIPKFDYITGGITPNTYYLIPGESGTGKSTVLYNIFIEKLVDNVMKLLKAYRIEKKYDIDELYRELDMRDGGVTHPSDIPLLTDIVKYVQSKLYIRLFSLEIGIEMVLLKILSSKLYSVFGEIYSTRYLLGRFGAIDSKVEAYWNNRTFQYYMYILERVFYISTYSHTADITSLMEYDSKTVKNRQIDDEPVFHVVALDHPSLTQGDKEVRLNINELSKEFIKFKNVDKNSVILIQQITPYDLSKKDIKFLIPDFENLRDSKSTYTDADVVWAVACPFKKGFTEIRYGKGVYKLDPFETSNEGYGLGARLIISKLIKDRYGGDFTYIPLIYIGETGVFYQAPLPEDMTDEDRKSVV